MLPQHTVAPRHALSPLFVLLSFSSPDWIHLMLRALRPQVSSGKEEPKARKEKTTTTTRHRTIA
jgi:hypothetical protein